MKKIILFTLISGFVFSATAQKEEEEVKKTLFKKENFFTGGTLNLAFGNQQTSLGISPFFGYSINKYVDVAGSVGINYISQRDNLYLGDKLRQTVYGPGAFVRLFPVRFLFAQAQYEFNFIRYKFIFPSGTGAPVEKYKFDAHSLLIGGGFATGRSSYEKSYYYFSVMWDISKAKYSPYKDNLDRAVPIIRAGYNIALFQGRNQR